MVSAETIEWLKSQYQTQEILFHFPNTEAQPINSTKKLCYWKKNKCEQEE